MVSVSRSSFEKGREQELSLDYFNESSTVGAWKEPRQIKVPQSLFQSRLDDKQREMASVGLGAPIERVVGRGAGLTDEAFERKKAVVKQAVHLHRPDPDDPLDVLSKVGSLDICGIAGTYLACAARRVEVY